MARRDVTGTVGFCLSLAIHAVFALVLIYFYCNELDESLRRAALPAHLGNAPAEAKIDPLFEPPPPSIADDLDLRRLADFGEAQSKGQAPNSSPGDRPLEATKAPQAQAFLSLDPEGPGRRHNDPSKSLLPPGMEGDGQKPGQAAVARAAAIPSQPPLTPIAAEPLKPFGPTPAPESQAQPVIRIARPPLFVPQPPSVLAAKPDQHPVQENADVPTRQTETNTPRPPTTLPSDLPIAANTANQPTTQPSAALADASRELRPLPTRTDPTTPPSLRRPDPPQAPSAAAPKQLAAAPSGSGPAGPPMLAADPAPQSESESDAFSREGSVRFRNGKLEARLGRGFKSVNPRLGLKAGIDTISIFDPSVVLRVKIDPTGKISDVQTLHSSGSDEIDKATERAMYQWWIEPAKDKAGNPRSDVILITFSYI